MTTRSVMRNTASLLLAFAACVANAIPPPQLPLGVETELLRKPAGDDPDSRRQLHGRFLHITGM